MDVPRRTAAALAILALLAAALAPVALALGDEGTPPCCRSRCCCSAQPRPQADCVRPTCHCGDRGSLPGLVALPDGVLAASPLLAVPARAARPETAADTRPAPRALCVPHPPPRPSSLATATV